MEACKRAKLDIGKIPEYETLVKTAEKVSAER